MKHRIPVLAAALASGAVLVVGAGGASNIATAAPAKPTPVIKHYVTASPLNITLKGKMSKDAVKAKEVSALRAHVAAAGGLSPFTVTTTPLTLTQQGPFPFKDRDGVSRQMTGSYKLRVAVSYDSSENTAYINGSYNWSGTGSGEGTGISVENFTNYIIRKSENGMIGYYGPPTTQLWDDDSGADDIHTQSGTPHRVHVAGTSTGMSTHHVGATHDQFLQFTFFSASYGGTNVDDRFNAPIYIWNG